MADSYNKKERDKKRKKRKKDKLERKEQRKQDDTKPPEFMYLDEDGNLTLTPPDLSKKKKVNVEDIAISTPKKEDSDESDFSRAGVVKFFNSDKGYGFIVDKETAESYFVHVENLIDPIKEHDKVIFEVGKGPKGPIALAVKLA